MQPLPLHRPEHVAALVELLQSPDADTRGIGDHFTALAGTHPEWFRPYQEQVVTELLDRFEVSFDDQCVLFAGAPDRCVDHLVSRLGEPSSFRAAWALAAIGTEAALGAVADDVRRRGNRAEYEDLGVWVPPVGAARYRFSVYRRAAFLRPRRSRDDLAIVDHPVGLRIDQIIGDPLPTSATWHYLSLRPAEIPGLPAWSAERLHLVGPRASCGWTLFARTDDEGRYHGVAVTFDEAPDVDEAEILRACESPDRDLGALELRPYDADLVYCNAHIQLTPGVVGTVGGPPIGLYPNPSCPSCGRLMFHVATVDNTVREYGDGWRSLYICEDCRTTASSATGSN